MRTLNIVLLVLSCVAAASSKFVSPAFAEPPQLCAIGALPLAVEKNLKENFAQWKLQDLSGLGPKAHMIWSHGKFGCPGIAVGQFTASDIPAYVVLLVPKNGENRKHRLVAFSRSTDAPQYHATILDSSNDDGSTGNYFVRSAPIGLFFDEASKRKFHAHAAEIILLTDSGANEYETDAFYWADGQFHRTWVDG